MRKRRISIDPTSAAILCLSHRDWRFRRSAARFLVGRIPPEQVSFVITIFQREQHPEVLKWLAMALARTGNMFSRAPLEDKLAKIKERNASDWIIASLGVLKPHDQSLLRDHYRSSEIEVVRQSIIGAWARPGISKAFAQDLALALERDSAEIRRWATLTAVKHEFIRVEPIIVNLADKSYLLREWSAHALTPLADKSAQLPLIGTLVDKSPRVREWAAKALGSYSDLDIDRLLQETYRKESDEFVREAIVLALLSHRLDTGNRNFIAEVLEGESSSIVVGEAIRFITSNTHLAGDRFLIGAISSATARFEGSVPLGPMFATALMQSISPTEKSFLDLLNRNPRFRLLADIALKLPACQPSFMIRTMSSRPKDMIGGPPTIAFVIALPEELEAVAAVVRDTIGALVKNEDPETALISYRAHHVTSTGSYIDLVFALIGKGQEWAAARTVAFLMQQRPLIVFNVGIAASLSKDARLCDVVIANQIISYMANAKARPKGTGFTFDLAGEPFRSDGLLVDRLTQLSLISQDGFSAWQFAVASKLVESLGGDAVQKLQSEGFLRDKVLLVPGPMASGPAVGAAEAFRNWLLRNKRDYIALDMESSGVATAVEVAGTIRRVRCLVARGISDFADERKTALEDSTKGKIRNVATAAALQACLLLLDIVPTAVLQEPK